MTQPQNAIFNEQSQSYHHLEYKFKDDVNLANIQRELQTALCKRTADINIVVAFGRNATNTLLPDLQLNAFDDFTEIASPHGKKAIASQGDIMFWIHSDNALLLKHRHKDFFPGQFTLFDFFGSDAI